MKVIVVVLFYLISQPVNAQPFFEGKVIYHLQQIIKDSSLDVKSSATYPADTLTFLFKQGNWINAPNAGMIEYGSFSSADNRQYYKYRGVDTLYYFDYSQLNPGLDTLTSVETTYHTDTLLGLPCHRLVLKNPKLTLTIIYSPQISVDPAWFSLSKGAYYDVIYRHTRSLYLVSIAETDQYISSQTALSISRQPVPDSIFQQLHVLPKVSLIPDK